MSHFTDQLNRAAPQLRHHTLWLTQDAEALRHHLSTKVKKPQVISNIKANIAKTAERSSLTVEFSDDPRGLVVKIYDQSGRGWVAGY